MDIEDALKRLEVDIHEASENLFVAKKTGNHDDEVKWRAVIEYAARWHASLQRYRN